jgi:hypothetical protein
LYKPILATSIYLKAIGLLVDHLVDKVMIEVRDTGEVSSEETHQLRYILGLLIQLDSCFERKGGRVSPNQFCVKWQALLEQTMAI